MTTNLVSRQTPVRRRTPRPRGIVRSARGCAQSRRSRSHATQRIAAGPGRHRHSAVRDTRAIRLSTRMPGGIGPHMERLFDTRIQCPQREVSRRRDAGQHRAVTQCMSHTGIERRHGVQSAARLDEASAIDGSSERRRGHARAAQLAGSRDAAPFVAHAHREIARRGIWAGMHAPTVRRWRGAEGGIVAVGEQPQKTWGWGGGLASPKRLVCETTPSRKAAPTGCFEEYPSFAVGRQVRGQERREGKIQTEVTVRPGRWR